MYTPAHARPGRGLARKMLGVVAITASFLVPVTAQSVQASDPTCPTSPDRCYGFTMATSGPVSPGPGQEATYTGTFRNFSTKGAGVSIGSANVIADPTGKLYDIRQVTGATLNGETFELRNLSIAPGRSGSFSFKAKAFDAGTITWLSEVKQANNFSGTGNNFYLHGPNPTTTTSGSCSGSIAFNSYGCKAFPKSAGAHIESGALDSGGNPAVVRAALDVLGINSPGVQVMGLRTYLQGDMCPVPDLGPATCDWTAQTLNKWDVDYTANGIISMTIRCGTLCDSGTPVLLFQHDEGDGITEPLLPCAVTLLPSPLTGSKACGELVNGVVEVRNITKDNDYKVMGIAVGGG